MTLMELYVVEYSASQDCFHVEQMEAMLQTNMKTVLSKSDVDYVPFVLCETHAEAVGWCDKMRDAQSRAGNIIDRLQAPQPTPSGPGGFDPENDPDLQEGS